MKKFVLIALILSFFGLTAAALYAYTAKPTPTEKISEEDKNINKDKNSESDEPNKEDASAEIEVSYNPKTFEKCTGPDENVAYALKEDCDNLWNYWNNNKPDSTNESETNSEETTITNSDSESTLDNTSEDLHDSNQEQTQTPTPTEVPTLTITPTPTTTSSPLITVTSPNGGEIVTAGDSNKITWTNTDDVERVSIYVNAYNSFRSLIIDNIPNTGYFDWIANLLDHITNLAKIEVIGWTISGNIIDESNDWFTVQYPTPTPTLTPTPTPTVTPTPTPDPTVVSTVTGIIFNDLNSNGIKDENEFGISHYEVTLGGYNQNHTLTDTDGKYTLSAYQGTYQLAIYEGSASQYVLTTQNNIELVLTQNTIVDFGVKLNPNLPAGKMFIQRVSLLPCNSSSCAGITTIIVEGVNFADDASMYLHRTDSEIGNSPRNFQDGDGRTHLVNRVGSTKVISDFQDVPCGNYYAGIYSPKNMKSATSFVYYICNNQATVSH